MKDETTPSSQPVANKKGQAGNRRKNKRRGRAKDAAATTIVVGPVATRSRMRSRHWGVVFSFLVFTALPVAAVHHYLYNYAVDQYYSSVGFSVRTEDAVSSLDVFGILSGSSNASSKDTDILYEFIQSKDLVSQVDQDLDLRSIWSWPEDDPIFVFDAEGTIEDLHAYWARMVRIDYEASTGLIEVGVLAFRPEDAESIALAIFDKSSTMINELSAISRADSTQYARDELELSEERLRAARAALAQYRDQNQLIDPSLVIQGQTGLLTSLQNQLAETLIELDLLRETSRDSDPRIQQAERKVEVIQKRIEQERGKFSDSVQAGEEGFSTLVSEFENLTVEREFAEQAYLAALSSYDATLAEARRQSRYLAPHARPSLPERSEYPKRITTLGLFASFNFLIWMIGVLIYYTIRDRR